MALSIKLNTTHKIDTNQTVSIVQGSGVSASSSSSSRSTITTHTFTPNSGVQTTVATITFTASTDYYYSKEPTYSLRTPYNTAYEITETVTKDSKNNVLTKVFLIKYTNTVNSIGEGVSFEHETSSKRTTTNTNNNTLLEITSFNIDTSNIVSTGIVRSFSVKGDANAYFSLKIIKDNPSGSDTTYDFTSGLFTASVTQLTDKIIDSTGAYTSAITFPAITTNDTYTVQLTPTLAKGTTLISGIQDSGNEFLCTKTINQYKILSITITSSSASYDGSYSGSPKYPTVTIKAERDSISPITTSFSWDLVLSANSYTLARTGNILGGLSSIDLRSSIAKVKNGNQSAGTTVLLDDVDGLISGMVMTGTGVTGTPRIIAINNTTKIITVSVSQDAQGDGGMADDASITFTYGGSDTSFAISGLEFTLENVLSTTNYTYNSTTLSPVETLVNGDYSGATPGSANQTINIDSSAGIKAGAAIQGRGVNSAVATPTVISVPNTTSVELSDTNKLDDNTPLTFTGSSRNANIIFDLTITDFGTKDHTLTLFLDNSLTVS